MIDREIHRASALLVDSNAMLRSVAAEQLRSAGIGRVTVASRPRDARLLIEREHFDIIVCTLAFDGTDDSGQDLLDELRRENQLSHSTVFLMITSEARYAQVVEAAEAALDGILVRPYTGAALAERLTEARRRKRELADVLRALEAGEDEVALTRALKRYQSKAAYAAWCGRLAAELFLQLNRPLDAKRVFGALVREDRPWARLGVARAMMAAGDTRRAAVEIKTTLEEHADSADAHDLMGRLLVEQCQFDAALKEYSQAVVLTPGCLLRTQHAGALAFYQGQAEEALAFLERAMGLGVQSKLFDALSLFLIAVLRHDLGDPAGVASMREHLDRYLARFPDSRRLRRLLEAARILNQMTPGAAQTALAGLRKLSTQAGENDFDMEAANVLLMLWSRLPAAVRPDPEFQAILKRLAMRFCTSKAVGEVLIASAGRSESALTVVRQCQTELAGIAEQAMDLALQEQPRLAVEQLLEAGERSLNFKLLELADVVARRHEATMPEAPTLAARATRLMAGHAGTSHHIAGLQRSGRSPGGLQLRGPAKVRIHVATA